MWRRLSTQLHHFAATAKISSTPRSLFRPSTISFSCSVIANYGTKDVKDNPVMLYMKGVPDLPRCRFSSLAVRVLKEYNVPLSARNILEDPELKNAVNAYK